MESALPRSILSRASILILALGAPIGAAAQAPATVEEHAEAVGNATGDDDIRLQLTAGATGAYGNARNIAFNFAGLFALRQGQHAFVVEASYLYGLAATRLDPAGTPPDYHFGDPAENTNNFNARMRYDFFLTPDDALFLVAKGRYDPFARLEPRIGGQAGYLRNLFREENHRFWGEVGYDFTYDNFGEVLDVGGGQLASDRQLHSLRLFVGYENKLNEVLTYVTGLEALMRLDRPEHWRFEWVNQFRSKLADWLQVSLDLTGRFDALPPGQAQAWDEQDGQATQMFDLIGTLNLVGTFDFYNPPEPEEEAEEEACDCPEPECPEPALVPTADEPDAPPADVPSADEAGDVEAL